MLNSIKKRLLVTSIALPLMAASGAASAVQTNSQLQSPLPQGTTTFNSTKTAIQSFTDNWTFNQVSNVGAPTVYLKTTLPTATNLSFSSMFLFDTTLGTTLWTYSTSQPVFWGQINPADNFELQINGVTTASLSQYNGYITAAVPEAPAWVLMLIGIAGVTIAVHLRQRRQGPAQLASLHA